MSKTHDILNQTNWWCSVSILDRSEFFESPQLDFSFADPNAAELGERPVKWEDIELCGVLPKLSENVTDHGVLYAAWDAMSWGELGCILLNITELGTEIFDETYGSDGLYCWTFRAEIGGETKYITVEYNSGEDFAERFDDPQAKVSIR